MIVSNTDFFIFYIYINMDNELRRRLEQIDIENFVFGIFIILILLAYYANSREKDYFINKNEEAKKEYYYIQIIIFSITVIISAYYVYDSYQEINYLRYDEYSKRKEYAYLSLIGSAAALIAGLIFLYIAITDTEIDAEISLG